jgi:nucleoside-diphosphate-sugar epimerase
MDRTRQQLPIGSRVLITGATGFTGSVLTRRLVQAGHDVRAIARPSSNLGHMQDLGVHWFRGEVFDPDTVAAAADGVEYIFHLAAAFREAKSTEEDYRLVHVASTQLLSQRAVENKNFKRLIHVSTMGVHGHIEQGLADETWRFAPGDGYQRTKAEAELWLKRFAAATGLPYTVIRPAAIYGPGDRRLLKFFRMACLPLFPLLGQGKCLYHMIHVEDLVQAMIAAATAPAALGEAFIIGNAEPIPLARIAAIVATALGKRTRVVRLPAWPFFLAADLCEKICIPLGIEPPIYRRRVAFYTKDRAFNTSKMRAVLGFIPRYTHEEGLAQTARWYVAQGWLKS